jgi:hypothetical protein
MGVSFYDDDILPVFKSQYSWAESMNPSELSNSSSGLQWFRLVTLLAVTESEESNSVLLLNLQSQWYYVGSVSIDQCL